MPDDLHQSQEPGEERILPAEWLRRLSQRREREGLERSAAEGGDPAAELVRKHLRDDVARVRADLDAMLSEVGEPAPPQPAVPASDAGQPLSPRQHEELRGEFKRRLRKSEKRIRKSLRKQAEAAG
ncbi:MAG TPA: hypothetical protein VG518_06735, partial [Solirubrobacterales bacterium]|nr:hypothetical protein [Solirubrobacterales bacterium]